MLRKKHIGTDNNFAKKTAHDGADRQTDRQTWRLLDQPGPEGRVGENLSSFYY